MSTGLFTFPNHLVFNLYHCEVQFAFKDCGQHVQPSFSESYRRHLTEFQPIKVVKNFDHLFLFILVQLEDIPRRKLLFVITYCLVNLFSPHAIQFCNVTIKQNRLITSQYLFITRILSAKFRRLIRIPKKYTAICENRHSAATGKRFNV